jgi:hypothetical protein
MPMVRSAIRRVTRKDKDSPLLVGEWRSRDRSEWRWMVVEMSHMHCSTLS